MVKPRHWWRRKPPTVPLLATQPCQVDSTSLRFFQQKPFGRCFNCLAREHRVATCWDLVQCFNYNRSGHTTRLYRRPSPTVGPLARWQGQ